MVTLSTPAPCENPNCREMVTVLTISDRTGEGPLRLCHNCFNYALRCNRLRSAKTIALAERQKRRPSCCQNKNCMSTDLKSAKYAKNGVFYCCACAAYSDRHDGEERPARLVNAPKKGPSAGECENPSCGAAVKGRTRRKIDGKTFQLCSTCYSFALRHNRLRSADLIRKRDTIRKNQASRAKCCQNPNCRSTNLFQARYRESDGAVYCSICATYAQAHNGEDRPKALVEAGKVHKTTLGQCENPDCGKTNVGLGGALVDEKEYRLCYTCYEYASRTHRLRSAELVETARVHKRQREARGDRCHNPNCQTTRLRNGGYGRLDREFYCGTCLQYMRTHNGKRRPKSLIKALREDGVAECDNPVCEGEAEITTRKGLSLCKACCGYYRCYNKSLRPAEVVRKANETKKRQKVGRKECSNPNCTLEFPMGKYSKTNGLYYCRNCCLYVDKHGEERPKKLIDEEKLRHSRYMWQLNHHMLDK